MGGHDEKDKWVVRSQAGVGRTLEEVLALRLSRRGMLKTLALGGSLVLS